MPLPNNRRRRLIVDPVQQTRMLLGIALAPSIILAVTACAMSWIYVEIDATLERSGTQAPLLLAAFLGASCFLFAAIAALLWHGLKTSHRVYGPIYRISKCVDEVRQGRFATRIKLRDGDHLTELADKLNDFLEWLEQHPPQGAVVADAPCADAGADQAPAEAKQPEPVA